MDKNFIYTHSGDKGYTSLINGKRVIKTNPHIKAYGTIDELNSFIGYLLNTIEQNEDRLFLLQIQNTLFSLGNYLASENIYNKQPILFEKIINLEKEIFKINKLLPPLNCFILPGSCPSNALAHICRTICRRAERCIILCITDQKLLYPLELKYINRLSDYFFLLARKQTFIHSTKEILWNKSS